MLKIKIIFLFYLFGFQLAGQSSVQINYNLYKSYRILDYNKANSQLHQEAQIRNIDENDGNTFEIGITKYWAFKEHLNIGLGVYYSRMGYNLKALKDIRWPSEITTTGYTFDPSLPHNISPSNFLNYFEVPIFLEFKSNGKYNFSPSFAIVNQFYVNSLAKSKTDIGNNSQFGVDTNISPYNLALTGGLGFGYKVSKFEFRIGVSYKRQMFNSVTNDISEKLYSYGINIGTRYVLK